MFRTQQDKASPNLNDLFVDGWSPNGINGISSRGWSKNDEHKDINGPEICWDRNGSVQPLGLVPMSDEDREVGDLRPLHFIFVLLMFLGIRHFGEFAS